MPASEATDFPLPLIEHRSDGDASAPPLASIVVLHGLGADGNDFMPVAQALDLSAVGPVRFVMPSAPVRPVTINAGYPMRAWYDIYPPSSRPEAPRREDTPGLRASLALVRQLLAREAARGGAPARPGRVGFSQGCAMTLLAGLRSPHRLAGLAALSGYLPLAAFTAAEITEAGRATPVFMAHGEQDDIVDISRGAASRDALLQLGCAVDWHSYPMSHSVSPEELDDLNAWLLKVLVT